MDEFLASLRHPLLERIISLLPTGFPIYLVGGAIRDALLNRPSYDLDFVTPGDSMKMARKLADELGAAYFPLDTERNVARVVLKAKDDASFQGAHSMRVDFSTFQGADLFSDLQGRDFTMNAMAVEIHHLDRLVDPLSGTADLVSKRLRACSDNSFLDDPVRILRAVRFSVDLDLHIQPETLHLMQAAISHLPDISAERLRDELFRILSISHPTTSLQILDKLKVLDTILPEVCMLKDVQQSTPHVMDVWNHTLDFLIRLESLLDVLAPEYDPEKAGNLTLDLVSLQLGRYKEQLAEHLNNALNPDRPHRGLIFLAGLYHDVGKLTTRSIDTRETSDSLVMSKLGASWFKNEGRH